MAPNADLVPALLLAAGMSTRMGTSKLALPWAGTTVLGHVIDRYQAAEVAPVILVTGANPISVHTAAEGRQVRFLHNPGFAEGEMISSIKVGLRYLLKGAWSACLVAPADLPELGTSTINALVVYGADAKALAVPSFRNRRGHPVLLGREYWPEILALGKEETLRDFFEHQVEDIRYIVVDDAGIRQDLDTPEEYRLMKPAGGDSPGEAE